MAERSFKEEVEKLRLGAGEEFHGEAILAVTKALLESGVSYVAGYQGAPISHLMDVLADANDILEDLGILFENSASEATAAAIRFLIEQRDVNGWGVEAVGTDAGMAFGFEPAFPAHHLMHGANKLGLASLTNLDQLPPTGAVIVTAPLKIKNGSGSPLRVLALVAG